MAHAVKTHKWCSTSLDTGFRWPSDRQHLMWGEPLPVTFLFWRPLFWYNEAEGLGSAYCAMSEQQTALRLLKLSKWLKHTAVKGLPQKHTVSDEN